MTYAHEKFQRGCAQCLRRFHSTADLVRHCVKTHGAEVAPPFAANGYTNGSCQGSSDRIDYFRPEKSTRTGIVRGLECQKCGRVSAREDVFEAHCKRPHDYGCANCPRCFVTKHLLISHCRQHHLIRMCRTRRRTFDLSNRPFGCCDCLAFFQQKYHLIVHLTKIHSRTFAVPEDATPCRFCGQYFEGMKRHMRLMHSDLFSVACNYCPKKFLSEDAKSEHEVRIHRFARPKRPYGPYMPKHVRVPCTVCGLLLARRSLGHWLSHVAPPDPITVESVDASGPSTSSGAFTNRGGYDEKAFKCSLCASSFALLKDINLHIWSKHPETFGQGTSMTPCASPVSSLKKKISPNRRNAVSISQISDRVDYFRPEKSTRRTRKGRGLKCLKCGRVCGRKETFEGHCELPHAYGCAECPRRFVTKRRLARHCQQHLARLRITRSKTFDLSNRPFGCSDCSLFFKQKCHLMAHLTKIHKRAFAVSEEKTFDASNRPFGCCECLAFFKQKYHLIVHFTRMHKRAFVVPEDGTPCQFCGQYFQRMNLHMRLMHSDLFRVACFYCPKKFLSEDAKSEHEIRVHRASNFIKCDFCVKRFFLSRSKEDHMIKCHPEEANCSKRCESFQHFHEQESYACEPCGKTFRSLAKKKIHAAKAHCRLCDFVIAGADSVEMAKHMRSVHSEPTAIPQPLEQTLHVKPDRFKCHVCDGTFADKTLLSLHLHAEHPGNLLGSTSTHLPAESPSTSERFSALPERGVGVASAIGQASSMTACASPVASPTKITANRRVLFPSCKLWIPLPARSSPSKATDIVAKVTVAMATDSLVCGEVSTSISTNGPPVVSLADCGSTLTDAVIVSEAAVSAENEDATEKHFSVAGFNVSSPAGSAALTSTTRAANDVASNPAEAFLLNQTICAGPMPKAISLESSDAVNVDGLKTPECREVHDEPERRDYVKPELAHSRIEFKCRLCSKIFYYESYLSMHMQAVHAQDQSVCEHCDKTFRDPTAKRNHVTKMHKCGLCDILIVDASARAEHMQSVHPKAKKVESENKSSEPAKVRQRAHQMALFICEFCPRVFKYRLRLSKHLRTVHSDCRIVGASDRPELTPFFQPKANDATQEHSSVADIHLSSPAGSEALSSTTRSENDIAFNSAEAFRLSQTYAATLMPKAISLPSQEAVNVEGLINPDGGGAKQKPAKRLSGRSTVEFKCELCSKLIKSRSTWLTHMRTVHQQARPFVCEHCGEAFRQPSEQRWHVWKMHKCRLCNGVVSDAFDRAEHMRSVHPLAKKVHGERQRRGWKPQRARPKTELQCDFCSQLFSNRTTWAVHMRTIHSQDRPFVCEHCDETFRYPSGLRDHVAKKHKCRLCDIILVDASDIDMTEHMRSIHPEARAPSESTSPASIGDVAADKRVSCVSGASASTSSFDLCAHVQCRLCKRQFATVKERTLHFNREHGLGSQRSANGSAQVQGSAATSNVQRVDTTMAKPGSSCVSSESAMPHQPPVVLRPCAPVLLTGPHVDQHSTAPQSTAAQRRPLILRVAAPVDSSNGAPSPHAPHRSTEEGPRVLQASLPFSASSFQKNTAGELSSTVRFLKIGNSGKVALIRKESLDGRHLVVLPFKKDIHASNGI